MASANCKDNAVFPAAVGPVRMTSGCFFSIISSFLYDPFKLLFQFIFAHGDDRRPSMGAVIGIFQSEQFVDQLFDSGGIEGHIALYRSLACHGCYFLPDHIRCAVDRAFRQFIQKFRKQLSPAAAV